MEDASLPASLAGAATLAKKFAKISLRDRQLFSVTLAGHFENRTSILIRAVVEQTAHPRANTHPLNGPIP